MLSKEAVGFVLLALIVTLVEAQEEPQITKEILPDIKRVGTTGRLNCTVQRQGINKVYWIHKNSETIISEDDDIALEDNFNKLVDGWPKYDVYRYIVGDRRTYQLVVRRLQLTDRGTYTCQIHYKGSTEHPSKDGKLIVLIPPTVIQSQTTQTLTAQQGSDVELECNADGYPKPNVTWVRPNGRPLPKPYNRFSVRGNILKLKNVAEDDRGIYRCVADNNVKPPAQYDAALYVQFKPTAKAVQSSYGQAQNRLFDIVIECRIAGFPEPDLKWYKKIEDGLEPISDDDKHIVHVLLSHDQTLSVTEFWYQLVILNVQANDYGEYYCEGTNRLGSRRATVILYETSECQGAWCPQESQVGRAQSSNQISVILFVTTALGSSFFHLYRLL